MVRKCSICKVEQPLTAEFFVKSKNRPHGFAYECKVCSKIRSREKHKINPRSDRYSKMTVEQKRAKLDWQMKYRRASPRSRAISLFKGYQGYDKKKGFEFNLTREFIADIITKPCSYCGDNDFRNIGCDRIVNSKGHTIDNVCPCCKECNTIKMDLFTYEEMKVIGLAIKKVKAIRSDPMHFSLYLG